MWQRQDDVTYVKMCLPSLVTDTQRRFLRLESSKKLQGKNASGGWYPPPLGRPRVNIIVHKFFFVRNLLLCRERCTKSNIVDHFPLHSSVHCGRNDPLYWPLVRRLQNPSQFPQFLTSKTSADPLGSPKGKAFCTDFEFADDVKLPCCPRCPQFSTTKTSANPSALQLARLFVQTEFADDIKLPCCPRCTTLSLDLWGRGVGARFPYQLCRRASVRVCLQGGHPLGPFAIRLTSWGHVERLPSRRLFCNRGSHSPYEACKERVNLLGHTSLSGHEEKGKTCGIHAGLQKYRAINAVRRRSLLPWQAGADGPMEWPLQGVVNGLRRLPVGGQKSPPPMALSFRIPSHVWKMEGILWRPPEQTACSVLILNWCRCLYIVDLVRCFSPTQTENSNAISRLKNSKRNI